jgi:hypothetical protein
VTSEHRSVGKSDSNAAKGEIKHRSLQMSQASVSLMRIAA